MSEYLIRPCERLSGEAAVSTAKNAVLPILAAGLLTAEPFTVEKVPALSDVETLGAILTDCGAELEKEGSAWTIEARQVHDPADHSRIQRMRASVLILGPLLTRTGQASVSVPGGCAIGQRPIDLHIKGMEALGASLTLDEGSVTLSGRLRGAQIVLDLPSVGATENIVMAAVLAEGKTRLENAAKEPEITDLCQCLNRMGARISGAGTGVIEIEGVNALHGIRYQPIPDRIEAGTLLCAGAITDGSVLLRGAKSEHMGALLFKLSQAGLTLRETAAGLRASGRLKHPLSVHTLAYPGFPTDMQAPLMAAALAVSGVSTFTESIFENRFMHAQEMQRLGAHIRVEGRVALVEGGHPLLGAQTTSTDLRAGAALMLAGLLAQGETLLCDPAGHIPRGYEDLPGKLNGLGAKIEVKGGDEGKLR